MFLWYWSLPKNFGARDGADGEGRMLRKVRRAHVHLVRLDAEELFDGFDADGAEKLGPLAVEEIDLAFVAVDHEDLDGVQIVGAGKPAAWI